MAQAITLVPATTIGLDLGDRFTHGCVLDGQAAVEERFRFRTTPAGLARAFQHRSACRVILEVGTHSPWISRWLTSQGHEVIVANPREIASITASSRKNDRADAEQLARLGRSDPALLRPIQHRGATAQRDRALLAVRRKLVATRSALVVQARGLAKALGERLPSATTPAFARRVREAGLEEVFPGLLALLETIEHLSQQIRTLDAQLQTLATQRYPETALLRQVPGVGPVTSMTYVLTLEDPQRFARSRRVGAYVGLRPAQRDSGDRKPQLSISKEGDRELRSLLVESAHWILVRGPDSELKRFAQRLIQRGGRAAKRKAIVALARKLAVVLHRIWVTGEAYDPFYAIRRREEIAMA